MTAFSRRTALLGVWPVFTLAATTDAGLPAVDIRPLATNLEATIREYSANGGDFGRGLPIQGSDLPYVAIILGTMGFEPYVIEKKDAYGQAFPLYGVSGGITPLLYRVWTRVHAGRHECVPIEYLFEERE